MAKISEVRKAVHISEVINRKLTGWESFPVDDGWEDCIVAGSFRFNADGSITINCQIDVNSTDGRSWGVDSRKIRLPRKGGSSNGQDQ